MTSDDVDEIRTCPVEKLSPDDPEYPIGEYVEFDGEYGVIETVIGRRARVNFGEFVPEEVKDQLRTRSVDKIPTPGDILRLVANMGLWRQ